MPLYEYKCEQCGRVNELIQKFSDEPLTTCEVCQGTIHRLMSAPALQFKGTGWYITDYAKGNKSGSPSNSGNGDSSKKSESSKSDSSKSDSSKSDSGSSSKPAVAATTSSSSDKK